MNGGCHRGALLRLLDGELSSAERHEREEHLNGCPKCRGDLALLSRLQGWLGVPSPGHPATDQITAYVHGELDAETRRGLAQHLAECPACAQLARAGQVGLEELARLERGRALLEAPPAGASLYLLAMIPAPPAPRALAASPSAEPPGPDERRLLLEEPELRLVYYRRGARALLGVFGTSLEEPVTCLLDGEERKDPPSLRDH